MRSLLGNNLERRGSAPVDLFAQRNDLAPTPKFVGCTLYGFDVKGLPKA